MSSGLPQPSDCCSPCTSVTITAVPGPAGPAGADGTDGTDGVNALTTVTANFTQPAIAGDVTVTVTNSTWAAVGQKVFVATGGYYTVNSQVDATHLSIKNTGYTGNAAPAAGITAPQQMSPGGIKGTDGAAGSSNLNTIIDSTYGATSARGQLLVDNGGATPNSNAVKLAAGTDGQILVSLSTDPTGLDYRTVIPNATTDNGIPRYDGAVGTPVPLQTSKIVITDNGAVQASGSGGNARGTDSVDLQITRSIATQVASGTNSGIFTGDANTASGTRAVVVGGAGNIASATDTFVGGGNSNSATVVTATVGGGDTNAATAASAFVGGGQGNRASGIASGIAGGEDNTASGSHSFIGAGQLNIASANFSACVAGFEGQATHAGEYAHGNGGFNSAGDAQSSELVLRRATANATPIEMFLDGAALRLTLPDDTTWTFDILIVARRTDANDESAAYRLVGCIDRNVGVATTALVGAVTKTVIAEDTAAWDVAATADAANGALIITVTGEAAKAIQWVARAVVIQTTG